MSTDGEQLGIKETSENGNENQTENQFGERLKALRSRQRDTQEDLGRKLHVSRQAVSNWEMGKAMPNHETKIRIYEIYGISEEYFTGKKEETGTLEQGESLPEIWQDDEQLKKVLLSCAIVIAVMLTMRLPFVGIGISVVSLAANRKWKICSRWVDVIVLFCLMVGLYQTGVIIGYGISCLTKFIM